MADAVRVRIAVAVDKNGDWCASSWSSQRGPDFSMVTEGLEEGETHYIVEAVLPIPQVRVIQGEVKEIPNERQRDNATGVGEEA